MLRQSNQKNVRPYQIPPSDKMGTNISTEGLSFKVFSLLTWLIKLFCINQDTGTGYPYVLHTYIVQYEQYDQLFHPRIHVQCWRVNPYHAAGVTRRQIQNVTKFWKIWRLLHFVTIFGITMKNAFKFKYKHAWYWFSNVWNSLSNFENFEKTKIILHGKSKGVNVKPTDLIIQVQ